MFWWTPKLCSDLKLFGHNSQVNGCWLSGSSLTSASVRSLIIVLDWSLFINLEFKLRIWLFYIISCSACSFLLRITSTCFISWFLLICDLSYQIKSKYLFGEHVVHVFMRYERSWSYYIWFSISPEYSKDLKHLLQAYFEFYFGISFLISIIARGMRDRRSLV